MIVDGVAKKIFMERQGKPPCATCPKHDGTHEEKKPLDEADDLFGSDWFWDVRQHFYECRAIGDFERPDPLMRAVIAEFDIFDRRDQGRSSDIAAEALVVLARRGGG